MLTIDSSSAQFEHMRKPPPSSVGVAVKDLTAVSCLDAYLPLYSFAAQPNHTGHTFKLSRKDSFPAVPDFFEESRFDSPAAVLGDDVAPYYSRSVDDDGFNSLPLSIHSNPSGMIWGPAEKYGCSTTVVPQLRRGMSRVQPRRNTSDVMLTDLGGSVDDLSEAAGGHAAVVPSRSLLETTLMNMWEERMDRGLFRYDVSQCPTRVLPGRLGFVAQLNEGRATKKRPTEFSMDRVMQPFDAAKFNFQKAAMSEALVAFCPQYDTSPSSSSSCDRAVVVPPLVPLAAAPEAMAGRSGGSPHLVFINVSPIDHGHVLLVPRVLDRLPQALAPDTVLLALQFARELGSPHFRVGYNSLGAFATINHLHFHSYYLPLELPCEAAATAPLPVALAHPEVTMEQGASSLLSLPRKRRAERLDASARVSVSRLVDYPVNGFVVEAALDGEAVEIVSAAALEAVAGVVGTAAERMQAANQPFNLLVSGGGRRVFVFPQCYAERQAAGAVPPELLETGVNPASFEIAGHLVLKRAEDFAVATDEWAARLLAEVSLDESGFMRVAELCFGAGAGAGEE